MCPVSGSKRAKTPPLLQVTESLASHQNRYLGHLWREIMKEFEMLISVFNQEIQALVNGDALAVKYPPTE